MIKFLWEELKEKFKSAVRIVSGRTASGRNGRKERPKRAKKREVKN